MESVVTTAHELLVVIQVNRISFETHGVDYEVHIQTNDKQKINQTHHTT